MKYKGGGPAGTWLTNAMSLQTDWLTIWPCPATLFSPKSEPPKITPGIPEKSPGSSTSSPYRPGAAVNGRDPSSSTHATLVYVDLPSHQGPPVDTIAGLEDALLLLQREATTVRRLMRSHQSRLAGLEEDIFVIHQDIASMKEKLETGEGTSE